MSNETLTYAEIKAIGIGGVVYEQSTYMDVPVELFVYSIEGADITLSSHKYNYATTISPTMHTDPNEMDRKFYPTWGEAMAAIQDAPQQQ